MDLDEMANACSALNATWMEAGAGFAVGPSATSAASADVRQFTHFSVNAPANLGNAPGQYATLYVDAIAQHVLALEALLRARTVTLAPWPLVRAALELAGRVAWLLEPSLGARSGERRVARFYLESLSSLQRKRFTSGKYDKQGARQAKRERDTLCAEAKSVFDDVQTPFTTMEAIESWSIHDEPLRGLGGGAELFAEICFAGARGLYDALSDYSHPSMVAVLRQTELLVSNGVTSRQWTVPIELVEKQIRLVCLIFYNAAHLIAQYNGVDDSALEKWVSSVASTWFSETSSP